MAIITNLFSPIIICPTCVVFTAAPPIFGYRRLQRSRAPTKSVRGYVKRNPPNVIQGWPAPSPDLNPLDFSVRDWLQETVWPQNPVAPVGLKCAIVSACGKYPARLRKKTCRSFKKRLATCVEADGGHFEHKL